jgi:hypothetical protein
MDGQFPSDPGEWLLVVLFVGAILGGVLVGGVRITPRHRPGCIDPNCRGCGGGPR